MRIVDFKAEFKTQLASIYPEQEIQSFFKLLLTHIIGWSMVDLILAPQKRMNTAQKEQFTDALSRLKKEEPIQYILGETEFCELRFKVNPNVLIPRPETEELVRWIVEDMKTSRPAGNPVSILDIGTGSGCIPISLAKTLSGVQVSAIDISEGALQLARENASLNEVEVKFIKKDILQSRSMPQKFDVIVSNPPYVRELEKTRMRKNVLAYEPHQALFVTDEDALLFYRKILAFSKTQLHPQGRIYFEINQYVKPDLEELFKQQGFFDYTFKKDIFDNWRMARVIMKGDFNK